MTRLMTIAAFVLLPTSATAAEMTTMGATLPVYTVLPFVALLLAIALLPLSIPEWWDHNRNKGIVAAACGIPVVVYMVIAWGHAGLAQCFELNQQLRGQCGQRQVDGAKTALQHNLGLGGACVVTMYQRT